MAGASVGTLDTFTGAPGTIAVRNPRNGEREAEITPPTPEELHKVCDQLRRSQVAWGAAPIEHRIEVLGRWADQLERAVPAILAEEQIDTGYSAIAPVSTYFTIANLRGWCGRAASALDALKHEGQSERMPSVSVETQLVPYGLVGFISPWNGPQLLSLVDAVPALFAGCAVLIKPSEVTPRFVGPLLQTVQAVPELAEVFAYVLGGGQTGADLIEEVDAICFTGSVPTGRKVAEACARRLIPAFLELGGNDPVIVTADADLENAATAVLRGAVFATGQGCTSTERIYVHDDIHDRFVDLLVAKAEKIRLNWPDPAEGEIGPFGYEPQPAIVDRHIDDALSKGAVVRTGGKSESRDGGIYMRPTVLTGVTHDMQVMREETFGPVMPVMRYRTEQEAIALANDTEFGLAAAVMAGTVEEGKRIARQINAGEVAIQDVNLVMVGVWDGVGEAFGNSGLGGARGGPASIHRFVRRKALMANSAPPAAMMPGA